MYIRRRCWGVPKSAVSRILHPTHSNLSRSSFRITSSKYALGQSSGPRQPWLSPQAPR